MRFAKVSYLTIACWICVFSASVFAQREDEHFIEFDEYPTKLELMQKLVPLMSDLDLDNVPRETLRDFLKDFVERSGISEQEKQQLREWGTQLADEDEDGLRKKLKQLENARNIFRGGKKDSPAEQVEDKEKIQQFIEKMTQLQKNSETQNQQSKQRSRNSSNIRRSNRNSNSRKNSSTKQTNQSKSRTRNNSNSNSKTNNQSTTTRNSNSNSRTNRSNGTSGNNRSSQKDSKPKEKNERPKSVKEAHSKINKMVMDALMKSSEGQGSNGNSSDDSAISKLVSDFFKSATENIDFKSNGKNKRGSFGGFLKSFRKSMQNASSRSNEIMSSVGGTSGSGGAPTSFDFSRLLTSWQFYAVLFVFILLFVLIFRFKPISRGETGKKLNTELELARFRDFRNTPIRSQQELIDAVDRLLICLFGGKAKFWHARKAWNSLLGKSDTPLEPKIDNMMKDYVIARYAPEDSSRKSSLDFSESEKTLALIAGQQLATGPA